MDTNDPAIALGGGGTNDGDEPSALIPYGWGGLAYGYAYSCASGPAADDCVFLARRFMPDVGFDWMSGESWVVRATPNTDTLADALDDDLPREPHLSLHLGKAGWYVHLWRSPAGHVFVADADGYVHVSRDMTTSLVPSWEHVRLPGVITGVGGLDESLVFAWSETAPAMYRFDGNTWSEMPCPGRVLTLRASSPDEIYVTGYDGLCAVWQGGSWSTLPLPTREAITGLAVVNMDELFVCGQGGSVFERSRYGWVRLARWPAPLHDVCISNGDLVLAAGDLGIWKIPSRGHEPEGVVHDLAPSSFDDRAGRIVVSTPAAIYESIDGKTYGKGIAREHVERARNGEKPLWLP